MEYEEVRGCRRLGFEGHTKAGVTGLNIGSIIVAFIGGVILLWIMRAVTGKRARV